MEAIQVEVSPELAQRLRIYHALRASGLMLELDPALVERYQAGAGKSRRTPVYVKGKPLSEIIVAERGPAWDDER